MSPEEFIQGVLKTESNDLVAIRGRVDQQRIIRLMHAALGMNTEQSEFTDMLKKHIFYGKPLDTVNLLEELGDQLWYIAIAIDELGSTFEEVMQRNNAKLALRYKQKQGSSFSETKAENRDLEAERKVLEGK